jgi:predicted RNA binding protein YcfA (HicA-like mRNA interferase family)
MKLPRDMDAATLIKALTQLGYQPVRQSGSHIRLECNNPKHSITIPNHRPLRVGTLAAIVSEIATHQKIEREALVRLLS